MKAELVKLRAAMDSHGVDVYYITMDDDHQSEYTDAYYNEIDFISGFSGSAGKLVVTADRAGLWTDGRYFVQAEAELKGSGIELMRMGEKDTPEILTFICEAVPEGGVVGLNGNCVSFTESKELSERLRSKGAELSIDMDLPAKFWMDRPKKTVSKCFILDERYTGSSAAEKLKLLKEKLDDKGAKAHIISTLDDIAWLLDLRAFDVPNDPVFSSFFIIDGESSSLYMDEGHLTDEVSAYLKELGIEVYPEECFYEAVKAIKSDSVLIESAKINTAIGRSLPKEIRIVDDVLPTTLMKCMKNPTEMANIRVAQLKDGIAMTRFMRYFKSHVGKGELTECALVDKALELRKEQEGFIEESFGTISAYGPNAAMCHYQPDRRRDVKVAPHGLYLIDSGGQYFEGTTDITRTFACGETTREEKTSYTLSVIANLRLSDARFKEGTTGLTLDHIAREPFWRRSLDYDHGTGHGVGCLLNVHERPVRIRYRVSDELEDGFGFSEGVYVSCEPGIYIEGSHGVRTENLLLCVNDYENEFGQFCRFEICTLCPMDKDPLDLSLMEERDIELFNAYHALVYSRLREHLDEEEQEWLAKACAPLVKM